MHVWQELNPWPSKHWAVVLSTELWELYGEQAHLTWCFNSLCRIHVWFRNEQVKCNNDVMYQLQWFGINGIISFISLTNNIQAQTNKYDQLLPTVNLLGPCSEIKYSDREKYSNYGLSLWLIFTCVIVFIHRPVEYIYQ